MAAPTKINRTESYLFEQRRRDLKRALVANLLMAGIERVARETDALAQ